MILKPELSVNNPNNPTHTTGTTFFGQFVDHDIMFDTTPRLGFATDPAVSTNSRTPSLDLDSVYGGGPIGSPQLYDPEDNDKLRISSGGLFEDLPRLDDGGTAIIPDPRNDENLMIAGLQCAFTSSTTTRSTGRARTATRAARRFHRRVSSRRGIYHWVVLHEFLPQIVGQAMVDDIRRSGRRIYKRRLREGFIPVEFQTGTYRMGHSMVRPSYRANVAGDNRGPFFAMISDPAGEGQTDPVDLRGGARAPWRFIGWQTSSTSATAR